MDPADVWQCCFTCLQLCSMCAVSSLSSPASACQCSFCWSLICYELWDHQLTSMGSSCSLFYHPFSLLLNLVVGWGNWKGGWMAAILTFLAPEQCESRSSGQSLHQPAGELSSQHMQRLVRTALTCRWAQKSYLAFRIEAKGCHGCTPLTTILDPPMKEVTVKDSIRSIWVLGLGLVTVLSRQVVTCLVVDCLKHLYTIFFCAPLKHVMLV